MQNSVQCGTKNRMFALFAIPTSSKISSCSIWDAHKNRHIVWIVSNSAVIVALKVKKMLCQNLQHDYWYNWLTNTGHIFCFYYPFRFRIIIFTFTRRVAEFFVSSPSYRMLARIKPLYSCPNRSKKSRNFPLNGSNVDNSLCCARVRFPFSYSRILINNAVYYWIRIRIMSVGVCVPY